MTDTTKTEALDRFEKAVARKAVLFLTYMGKAMPDEVYSEFATLRDDTIPSLRKSLSAVEAERDALLAAIGNKQLADFIEKHGDPVPIEAERDRLAAECEALRADAERYRWLRNEAWGGNNKTGPHLVQYKPGLMPSAVTELAEEAADAMIDAAMGGKE